MNIVGDVKGKKTVIVDDIIDTAGTLTNAAHAIMNAGAASVAACASHAVFSGKAVQRINDSPLSARRRHQHDPAVRARSGLLEGAREVSVGRLLGEAIKRIHHGDSISSLFM